ncbi:hypothetical protein [Pedobacter panaciterrae]
MSKKTKIEADSSTEEKIKAAANIVFTKKVTLVLVQGILLKKPV